MHWSEFVFPPTCPGCGTEVWHRGEWCEACFNELYDVRHVTDLDGLALREVYVIGHYDKGLKIRLIFYLKIGQLGLVGRGLTAWRK